jgi:hypothetical protein
MPSAGNETADSAGAATSDSAPSVQASREAGSRRWFSSRAATLPQAGVLAGQSPCLHKGGFQNDELRCLARVAAVRAFGHKGQSCGRCFRVLGGEIGQGSSSGQCSVVRQGDPCQGPGRSVRSGRSLCLKGCPSSGSACAFKPEHRSI